MTLRIQCPACQRQFTVGEELNGRTVECGACEKQFVVDEASIASPRDRYFPGDRKKPGLDHYGSPREARHKASPVQFATANYDHRAKAADVIPPSPQRVFAGALGVIIQVLFVVVMLAGGQEGGFLRELAFQKRIVLSGFVAFVGACLIFYGVFRRRKLEASASIVVLAAAVMGLAVLLPGPERQSADTGGTPAVPKPDDPPAPVPERKTEQEVALEIGYGPVEKAVASFSYDSVVALWVPELKASFTYQVQRYLHRKVGTGERPSVYARGSGGLIVIEGTKLSWEEIEAVVERFATVDEAYPGIRVFQITIQGERLVPPSPALAGKLRDPSNSAFYSLNLQELDHIDIDRVEAAARRLADAEPVTLQPQIAERLVDLLDESNDPGFRSTLCDAIMVWSKPGDGAEKVVTRMARDLIVAGEELPLSMVRFLITRKAPETLSILEMLWVKEQTKWEPLIVDFGEEAQEMVVPHLSDEDRSVQRSAVTILKRIGSPASLPALRSALEDAGDDAEMTLVIQSAIETLEAGGE